MPADSELWLPSLSPKAKKWLNDRKEHRWRKGIKRFAGWFSFSGKTFWDLLGIIAIPVVIAVATMQFSVQQSESSSQASERQHQTDLQIAQDQQQENTLQTYLDRMSDLLLNGKLRESQPEDEVRNVARSRTLTVLPWLNGIRKGEIVRFLQEASLIDRKGVVVHLELGDLSNADLKKANLNDAFLFGTDLHKANLSSADLRSADLSGANVGNANLLFADLEGASLNYTKLSFADITGANLSKANLNHTDLSGANLSGTELNDADLSDVALNGAYLATANLKNANLTNVFLNGTNLSNSNLVDTNLINTDLRGADLSYADLTGAKITDKQLAGVKSLQGATMPDGSIHP